MSRVGGTQSPQAETLDLRAYTRPIWRWKWIVLAITILATGGTYALTSRQAKTYTASTRVYVQDPDPAASVKGGQPYGPPTQQSLQDVAALFTGQAITNSVYRALGLPVGSAGSVVVSAEGTASFVDATASSRSPVLAARLANTYVSVFLASQASAAAAAARSYAAAARATLRTIPKDAANEPQRLALLAQIDQYETVARAPSSGARQVDAAAIPSGPSSPKPTRDALFAGVIGLLFGIGLAFVLDLLDRRLVRVSSVQALYGRSVVGVVPHVSKAAPRANGSPTTPPQFVEVMRNLRVNLRLAEGGPPPKSVLITSGLPSEGKSTVARDLAFAYADAGERVLLIDCDLRRPSVAHTFGVEPEPGLVQLLRREATPAEVAVSVFRTSALLPNGSAASHVIAPGDPRANGSIDIIAHGERIESPVALLSSQVMTGLLATATSRYDIVILDTSPILTVSDAVPLLEQVDAVLFVVRLGMTTQNAAERLTELAERVPGMNLVGIVVNDMRDKYVDEGYASYSEYGYGYSHATR